MRTLLANWYASRGFKPQVAGTFLASLLAMVLGVANAALLARWLGPSGKGLFALTILCPAMLSLMLRMGMSSANVYFAGSGRLDLRRLASHSVAFAGMMALVGVLGMIGLVVTGATHAILPGVPAWLLMVAMIGLPIDMLSTLFSSLLQGMRKIAVLNLCSVGKGLLQLGAFVLLVIVFDMQVLGAVIAVLAAGLVILGIKTWLLGRYGADFRPRWRPAVARPTLAFGLKGYGHNICQFLNHRLDMFVVNFFVGPAGVGIYSVAVALAEMLLRLPDAVAFVIFPKSAQTPAAAMNAFTPRVLRVTLGLVAVGGIALALVGETAIELLFSSVFASAYVPMLILLPGVLLLGGTRILTNEIAGRGFPLCNTLTTAGSLLLTVVLDLTLIPRHGVMGAAIASSIAYAAGFGLALTFYTALSRRSAALAVEPIAGLTD